MHLADSDRKRAALSKARAGLWVPILAAAMFVFAGDRPMGEADAKASELAEKTMMAMGGWDQWEQTRFIAWTFFGRRHHVWDKHSGDIRVETPEKEQVILMNVHTKEGRAWEKGEPVEDETALATLLDFGYKVWINDAYWLVMPYKLRDPGVTLTYTREDKTEAGEEAQVLTMTFQDVGVTPENKYEVFIDKKDFLVKQWSFFPKAEDSEPRFSTPWADWRTYGSIKLSGNRGKAQLDDIAVFNTLPTTVFSDPAPWRTNVPSEE